MRITLDWSVNENGLTFNVNGQVAQYSHQEGFELLQNIQQALMETPRAESPVPQEKAGEIAPLTPEVQAALLAAEAAKANA